LSLSALIRDMIAEGATPQLILIAVEAIEARDAAAADRRAMDAQRTRRYRQRGGGQVDAGTRQKILERDGFACLNCGSEEALEIDHIIPLAGGGHPTDEENLQTLCRSCNAKKRDRIRKADKRGKMRTNADIHNCPQNTPFPPPPNENNLTPPTHTPVNKTPARKETPFPDQWEPILTPAAKQIVDGWPPGMFERQLASFRDHAADKGRKSKDWQAAFRTWINKADERKPKNGTANRTSSIDRRSSLARAIDEGIEFLG